MSLNKYNIWIKYIEQILESIPRMTMAAEQA